MWEGNKITVLSRTSVALEHFLSSGDCLLEQVDWGDFWPGRYQVAMGISGVVVHDCRLGGGGGGIRDRARGWEVRLALVTLGSGLVFRLRKPLG